MKFKRSKGTVSRFLLTGLLPFVCCTAALSASLDCTIDRVDSQRDELTVNDHGHSTLVDVGDAAMRSIDGARINTQDLNRGTRIHLDGDYIDGGTFAATLVRVMSLDPARNTWPNGRPAPSGRRNLGQYIELRGTVSNTNDQDGSFDVHVGSHQRTVFVTSRTNFVDIDTGDGYRIPVHPGDRVTVKGNLKSGGTVDADEVSLSRNGYAPSSNSGNRQSQVTGQITKPSDRYSTRDFSIRTSNRQDIRVKVPKNITILRGDQHVSVHDLSTDDVVTVTGRYDGQDFEASTINVDGSYR